MHCDLQTLLKLMQQIIHEFVTTLLSLIFILSLSISVFSRESKEYQDCRVSFSKEAGLTRIHVNCFITLRYYHDI